MQSEERKPLVSPQETSENDTSLTQPLQPQSPSTTSQRFGPRHIRLYRRYWRVLTISIIFSAVLAVSISLIGLLWFVPSYKGDKTSVFHYSDCTIVSLTDKKCTTTSSSTGLQFILTLSLCLSASNSTETALTQSNNNKNEITELSSNSSGEFCDSDKLALGTTTDKTCWDGWQYKIGMKVGCFYDSRRRISESLSIIHPKTIGISFTIMILLCLGFIISLAVLFLFTALLPQALRLRSVFQLMSPNN